MRICWRARRKILQLLGWGFSWCLPCHKSVPFTPGRSPGRRRAGGPGGHCCAGAVAAVEPAVSRHGMELCPVTARLCKPTGFAAQVWAQEPTQSSAGSEEQPWLRGSLGRLGCC